jgi:hypothetical protein
MSVGGTTGFVVVVKGLTGAATSRLVEQTLLSRQFTYFLHYAPWSRNVEAEVGRLGSIPWTIRIIWIYCIFLINDG